MVCEPKDGPRCPLTNALNLNLKLRGPCGRQFAYFWDFALCLHSVSRLYIEFRPDIALEVGATFRFGKARTQMDIDGEHS